MGMRIRDARPEDVPAILQLIVESAESQGSRESVCVDAAILRREMFGPAPRAHALVADDEGRLVGLALYCFTFSTWTSVNGIHLEDLYVTAERRRHGVARELMGALEAVASAHDCGRLQWFVLRSNAGAIRFYETVGARVADDWRLMQLPHTPRAPHATS